MSTFEQRKVAIERANENATSDPAATVVTGAVAVTGPLTDTQLRATPVPVSGTVTTAGLTDTQLRATPVPVSGTVTASGPVTDTQLRATAVPVSLASMPSTPVTGSFYQSTQPVSVASMPTTPISLTDATTGLAASVSANGVNVHDHYARNLLHMIVTELRVMNLYLSHISGQYVDRETAVHH